MNTLTDNSNQDAWVAVSAASALLLDHSDHDRGAGATLDSLDFGPLLPESAKVLIVDDEPINVKIIQKYLREFGYTDCHTLTDSTLALEWIKNHQPDVVLLDVVMPQVTGLEILVALRTQRATAHLPVIVLTASCDRETKLAVLDRGATDLLSKPVDPSELAPRVRNALMVKKCHDSLRGHAQALETAVRKRTAELEASRKDVVYCLARAAEMRDDATGQHVLRVGQYAAIVGKSLGMSELQVEMLEQAAQLHDIGKIGVPDQILHKPGKLDPAEIERMRKHVGLGQQILEPRAESAWNRLQEHPQAGQHLLENCRSPLLRMAARIAATHHEWWNGEGYPAGLEGEEIPLEGRITAVADVFDALSSERPYKVALPLADCFAAIEAERGRQFDPRIVDLFLAEKAAISRVRGSYSDKP